MQEETKKWGGIEFNFTSGWSMNLMAFDKFSTLSWDIGIGAGPNSFSYILSPQKNWSPKNGTMVVGHCKLWYSY